MSRKSHGGKQTQGHLNKLRQRSITEFRRNPKSVWDVNLFGGFVCLAVALTIIILPIIAWILS